MTARPELRRQWREENKTRQSQGLPQLEWREWGKPEEVEVEES